MGPDGDLFWDLMVITDGETNRHYPGWLLNVANWQIIFSYCFHLWMHHFHDQQLSSLTRWYPAYQYPSNFSEFTRWYGDFGDGFGFRWAFRVSHMGCHDRFDEIWWFNGIDDGLNGIQSDRSIQRDLMASTSGICQKSIMDFVTMEDPSPVSINHRHGEVIQNGRLESMSLELCGYDISQIYWQYVIP